MSFRAIITDTAGNTTTGSESSTTLHIDQTAPIVSTFTMSDRELKKNDTSTVTIEFSESVINFSSSDISAPNGSLSSFSGSGTSYSVTYTPNNNITDSSNILTIGTNYTDNAGNAPSTSYDTLNFSIDTISPSITITASNGSVVNSGDLTNDSSLTITFTSTESTSNFIVGDITTSNGSLSSFSGSGTTYTATFTPTEDGTCTIDINAGVYTDDAGNNNTVSTQFVWNSDQTAPTIITTHPLNNSLSNSLNLQLYLTFSEIVNVNSGNITIHDFSNDNTIETIDITSGLVTGSGTQLIIINPSTTLSVNKSYYINIGNTALRDNALNNFLGISDNSTLKFSTITSTSTESGSKIIGKIIESNTNLNHNDIYDTYLINSTGDAFTIGCDDSTNNFKINKNINLNYNDFLLIDTEGTVTIKETIKSKEFLLTSDKNLKNNITELKDVSKKINKLNGVKFNWKDENKNENLKDNIGLIAQEVEEEFPELVFNDKKTNFKSVNYSQFVSVLIQGYKEMNIKINSLKNNVNKLLNKK